ncbi:MAG: hypothetical protein IJX16_04815 [Clostridia bacterium]|nr:hypothetical protein [Clostridia bacterium]
MPQNLNSTILQSAWLAASTDYQQVIPECSQGEVSATIAAFSEPNAGRYFNEITGLFNTIGMTRIKSRRWENPLEFLEGGALRYGHSVREIAVKWAKAHCYDSDAQTLLKRNLPKFVEAFHSIDRLDRYDTSISRTEFLQSLTPEINGDGYGLDTLLGAIFDSIYSPEAYDSMRYTLQVIAESDKSWGGLMRENVPEITDKETGAKFMKTIESLALRWRFPSSIYNNVEGLPVFTNPDDLVLLTTPETLAAIDFDTLANLFHAERGEDIRRRVVLVPDFPIPNVRAILADRSFFVIHRSLFTLENFYNPQQIVTNYYLHSQGVWSASPLANIVLLGDFESTEIPTVTVAPKTLVLTADEQQVARGGMVHINADLRGTVTGANTDGVAVKPDAVIWGISAASVGKESKAVELNRDTYVDRFGNLHCQKTIEAGTIITVNATSTYINPSGETNEIAAEPITITVTEPA